MLASPQNNRFALYFLLNMLFLVVIAIGYSVGGQPDPRLLHLALLFALCSSTIIDLDGINGRYALLSIFLGMYFIYFGVQDLTDLFDGFATHDYEGIFSTTEAVILIGGIMLILGYRAAVSFRNPLGRSRQAYDWTLPSMLFVGIAMWAVGISATYYWYFFVVIDKTLEGTKGIARLSQLATTGLVLAEMLQPLGILLLAYAWRVTKSPYLFAVVLVAVCIQVLFGFIIDIKGMAISGASLVVVTIIFAEGRIPKIWIAGVAVFIYLAFPVFQAYRAVITGNGVARTEVLQNLGKTLDKVLEAKERVNSGHERAQTFLERLSLKASVQMIVNGTAKGIPFQHGYTMTPILSAFFPRIFWSDKPDIPTGRIVNRVFNVTDQDETYISPSHLGELYWNFGWPGVVVGMTAIGVLCGIVARFNLAESRTVTRLLILVVSVEGLIHGFEGSLSSSYVVWLRSIAAIGLLHLAFARVLVAGPPQQTSGSGGVETAQEPPVKFKLFPNLLN